MYNNYRRFEMDRNNFQTMVNALQAKYGRTISKPIAVVGNVPPYPTLRNQDHPFDYLPKRGGPSERNGENRFSSVGVRREFYLFARHVCGFVCSIPSAEQVEQARRLACATGQPAWPMDGYIRECPDLILVNLGEGMPPDRALVETMEESYLSDNERVLMQKLGANAWKLRLRTWADKVCRALE